MCNCWSGLCQGGPVGVMRVAEQARGKTGSLQPQARAAVLPAPPPRGHVELKRGLAAVRVVSRQKQVCPECRFCTQSIQSLGTRATHTWMSTSATGARVRARSYWVFQFVNPSQSCPNAYISHIAAKVGFQGVRKSKIEIGRAHV